jgi:hypothetical protein
MARVFGTVTRATVVLLAMGLLWHPAGATTLYGVPVTGNFLVEFESTAPQTIASVVPISGLQPGERLAGIDFRPATGQLFGLGISTGATDTGRLYTIDPATGRATPAGAGPFATDLLTGSAYGFDFNPTVDRIRVINVANESGRINPNNGARADFPTNDTNLNPAGADVTGVAYDRNDTDPNTATTLFGIDTTLDMLVTIGGIDQSPSPNGGAVFPVGSFGVNAVGDAGFDIDTDGTLFAALTVGGINQLYTVNPATGAATLIGPIGDGNLAIGSLAAAPPAAPSPPPPPANLLSVSPPSGSYATNQRFDLQLFLDAPGRVVVGGQALLDGTDVTGPLVACVIPGALLTGGQTFRCPGLSGALFGPGTHTLQVTLQLDDGSSYTRTVTYEIVTVIGGP